VQTLLQDLRYGLRMLRKSPGFTAVAVLTLALGIGANTSIFSVIDAMLLRPLPVRDPGQLVQVAQNASSFSYPAFKRFRDENHVFSGVLAVSWLNQLDIGIDGQTESVDAQLVSGNFFSLLGVGVAVGRTFSANEDKSPRQNPVAVISYGYWKRRFALDPSVVGKSITLNRTPFTILGVTPPEFSGIWLGYPADVYVPMMMEPAFHQDKSWLDQGDYHWIQIMGRLKPGVSRAKALADLALIHRKTLEEVNTTDWSPEQARALLAQRLELVPASSGLTFGLRQEFSQPLSILMTMVGLVLLIACTNVANLLLGRATARQKEIAVRLAIGAGRFRLIRQLLTESLLLGLAGGATGLLLAYWSGAALTSLMSMGWGLGWGRLELDLRPDPRVLAFTGAVSALVAVLFGLVPALRATRLDLTPALKENGRNLKASRPRLGLGKALVVSQVAFSLLLLFGAGLFVRTLENLEGLDAGFSRHNVVLFSVDAAKSGSKGADVARVYQQLQERFEAVPGVRSASLSLWGPVTGGGGWDNNVWVEGYTPRPDEDMTVYLNAVGPRYFETIGAPILIGRDFDPRDSGAKGKVAIINQAMARYYFGNSNPLGRRFGWGKAGEKDRAEFEIVGVVRDSKYETLREAVPRTAYLDCFQDSLGAMTFLVRTAVRPAALTSQIRAEILATGKDLRIGSFSTLEEHVDSSLGHERLMATLSTLFGILALLVASVGLYGIMAYAVARRTREIGIRMALGARTGDVLRMVLGESIVLIGAGVAIGIPLALGLARLIANQLFGLKPHDPLTLIGAALVLAGVALAASYIPARRATKVDPMVALRYE
jgi:putative ABC transport system permease protein